MVAVWTVDIPGTRMAVGGQGESHGSNPGERLGGREVVRFQVCFEQEADRNCSWVGGGG